MDLGIIWIHFCAAYLNVSPSEESSYNISPAEHSRFVSPAPYNKSHTNGDSNRFCYRSRFCCTTQH